MSQVSKLIYKELKSLIPDIQNLKPFEKHDLKAYGFANIHLIILEATSHEINIILSHYDNKSGVLVSNPSVEIAIYPYEHKAEVVMYKDRNFTYQLFMDTEFDNETDNVNACSYVNRLVYEWLKELKFWSCNKRESVSPLWLM